MKISFEKLALAGNVFLPVIILGFVVTSYFYTSNKEAIEDKGETEQVTSDKKQLLPFQTSVELENRGNQQLQIRQKTVDPSSLTSSKFLNHQ